MSHKSQLEQSKYRNWVRGGLAYKYLKEGIEGFADDVVQKEHTRILGIVNSTSRIACNHCSFRTLQPLHISKKDHTGRKRCPWDLSSCNCLYSSKKNPCTNNVCDVILEEILKTHGSTPPSPNWKNTDVQKWYTSPWEIAKCFINAPGYSDKTKAADIDASGLLHVFINNKNLHTHLSCNMTGKNIFIKCRERRNKLFHSPAMELEDAELTVCIDDIIAILEDPKELAATADAQQAVLKLKQLKHENFIITTHNEAEVCIDALAYITNKTVELNQMIQEAKDDIDKKHADASKAIYDKLQTDLQDALAENSDIKYLKQSVEILFQIVDNIKGDMRLIKKHLEEIDKDIGELKAVKDLHMEKMKYIEQKQALQDGLVKLYQRHYVKTSLSPLKHQENDINIDEVYVEPNMVVVEADKYGADNSRLRTGQQEYRNIHEYHDFFQSDGQSGAGNSRGETDENKERYIHGYHDLFQSEEKENKAIYIVGDVGAGKSSFCKKMIQDWCKSASENWNISVSTHGDSTSFEMTDDSNTIGTFGRTHESKESISDDTVDYNDFSTTSGSDSEIESLSSDSDFQIYFSVSDSYQERACKSMYSFTDTFDRNIDQMKRFGFLFYIPLRKMSKYGETSKMIQAICTTANLASADLIEKVFEQDSERCLIVIDGLDEWRPQQMETILSHESSGLPLKHGINNATVVTLSRPSAKGMLNIRKSEIDQKVELKGICQSSVQHFITKYLPKLKKTHIYADPLMKKITKSKLKHLENTPLLLQQLVWMYCNEIDFGKTVSDIYSHLINIMFGWFQSKTDTSDSEDDFPDNAEQYNQMTLPKVLNSFPRCEENKRLLIQIAKVAFESITSEPEKNSFSRSHLKKKGVSKTDISSLIDVGLLVKENCYDPTQEKTQISFIHMSYLEFFAAVYASCQFDEQQSDKNTSVLTEIFQNCKTAADILQLSNLLKIICGLCPFVITQVSHFISEIVKMDENPISEIVKMDENPMRQHSEKLSLGSSLHQIQELILSFLSECDPTVKTDTMVYIADVFVLYGSTAIKSIIPDNVISLIVMKYPYEEIWKWMTQLKHLQCLDLLICEPSHDEMTMLCSFIKEAPLRCIFLSRVRCQQHHCRGHSIDLSKHERLQKLEILECDEIKISNINTGHLETIHLSRTETLNCGLLQNSRCLSELRLGEPIDVWTPSVHILKYNKDVDTVVHTLHQLQKLAIMSGDIDENALTVTPEMRNLNHITLHHVEMSLETWRTFVDSLLTLQQSVQVTRYSLSTGSDFNNLKEKKKYVKEKENMFEILRDDRNTFYTQEWVNFIFRTRKQ